MQTTGPNVLETPESTTPSSAPVTIVVALFGAAEMRRVTAPRRYGGCSRAPSARLPDYDVSETGRHGGCAVQSPLLACVGGGFTAGAAARPAVPAQ